MAKLQLRTNVPEVIALQFTTGKEVESTFNGTEVLFSLEDGRIWYVHPSVARKIDALSLGKGEPFEVVKVEAPGGKGFTYDVKHVAQAAAALPSTDSRQNGTATTQVVHTAQQNSSTAASSSPAAQRMMAAFAAAIEAIAESQAALQRKGIGITLTSDNLTSTALSIFIQASKGGC
jgi:hypothetical protein